MKYRWKKEEINYLKKEYFYKKNKDLAKELKKTESSIENKSYELKLKKDKEFYCKARKHLPFEINKRTLENMYLIKKISIRRIAKELKISKTTIEYYLIKYKIKRRTHSEANKERFKWDSTWRKGKTKDDPLIKKAILKQKETCEKNRLKRIKEIESRFEMSFSKLLNKLYWEKELNLEEISKKLGLDRKRISDFFKEYDISLRPNFEYISSLKGRNHSHYGKSWEEIFGEEKASKLKMKVSLLARKRIIQRLKNNEMPFLNTQIEKSLANELIKRKIPFKQQFVINNRFVCDFAIPNFNIIIECDGDYWHANPQIYNINNLDKRQKEKIKRDRIKDEYLIKNGWRVLRFFETDIKSSIEQCGEKIERTITANL